MHRQRQETDLDLVSLYAEAQTVMIQITHQRQNGRGTTGEIASIRVQEDSGRSLREDDVEGCHGECKTDEGR